MCRVDPVGLGRLEFLLHERWRTHGVSSTCRPPVPCAAIRRGLRHAYMPTYSGVAGMQLLSTLMAWRSLFGSIYPHAMPSAADHPHGPHASQAVLLMKRRQEPSRIWCSSAAPHPLICLPCLGVSGRDRQRMHSVPVPQHPTASSALPLTRKKGS